MKEPTVRQGIVLQAVRKLTERLGKPPTLRELAREVGIKTPRGVSLHLIALARKGWLRRGRRARDIALTRRPQTRKEKLWTVDHGPWAQLPVLGPVWAGGPNVADQEVDETIELPDSLFGTASGNFVLRVKGDSMIEDGIQEGDLVIVQSQPTAQTGERVVALVDGQTTVKILAARRGDGRLVLEPRNPHYRPIAVTEQTRILGKVVGLIRRMR